MNPREPGNVTFMQFLVHPNFTPCQPTIPVLLVLIFGCNRNLMKYIFLGSANIIDYHCSLDFCRPFYAVPKNPSNTTCLPPAMTDDKLHDLIINSHDLKVRQAEFVHHHLASFNNVFYG